MFSWIPYARVSLLTAIVPFVLTAVASGQDGKLDSDGVRRFTKPKRRIVTPIKQQLRAVAFSPDGKRIAAGGDAPDVYAWDVATGKEVSRFPGHAKNVTGIAFSPDGKSLATGGPDGVKLWDLATNKVTAQIPVPLPLVSSSKRLVFSPGSELLALSSANVITIWDVKGKRICARIPTGPGAVFSPDGKRLAVITNRQLSAELRNSYDVSLNWWNPLTGKPAASPHAALPSSLGLRVIVGSAPKNLAFSKDGKFAALSGKQLFDLAGKKTFDLQTALPKSRVWGGEVVGFGRDAKALVLTTFRNSAVLDLPSGKLLGLIVYPDIVDAVALSPDGSSLASVMLSEVFLWDVDRIVK